MASGSSVRAISPSATRTGVAAGLLWWSYFDRVQPAVEHRADELEESERGRFVRDVYTYAHAPIVAGVILIAVGFEDAALHPTEPLSMAFRAMIFGGISLFVVGVTACTLRAFGVVPVERIGLLVGAAVVLLAAGPLDAVWLIVLIDVVTLLALAAEHYRIEVTPGVSAVHHRHD